MFSALAEPTRRRILTMLARRGQLPASAISRQFRVSAPAISQHLKILREARLVRMEKRAQQHIYRINPETMHELEDWARQMTATWNDRFDRLEALLQEHPSESPKSRGRKDKKDDNAKRLR